jgi:hypothetical protein
MRYSCLRLTVRVLDLGADSAAQDSYSTVLGLYYSALSVVIVYHLFALQTWLQLVQGLGREAVAVERSYALHSLERRDLVGELEQSRRDFPLAQLLILGIAIGTLAALVLVAAARSSLPFIFSGLPTIVLLFLFSGSSVAAWIRGSRWVRAAIDLLGE